MMWLINKLNIYTTTALSIAIIVLLLYNAHLKSSIRLMEANLLICNNEIKNIIEQSNIHQQKIDVAVSHAEIEIEKDILESKEILDIDVSSNCEDAIKWGIEKSKIL